MHDVYWTGTPISWRPLLRHQDYSPYSATSPLARHTCENSCHTLVIVVQDHDISRHHHDPMIHAPHVLLSIPMLRIIGPTPINSYLKRSNSQGSPIQPSGLRSDQIRFSSHSGFSKKTSLLVGVDAGVLGNVGTLLKTFSVPVPHVGAFIMLLVNFLISPMDN